MRAVAGGKAGRLAQDRDFAASDGGGYTNEMARVFLLSVSSGDDDYNRGAYRGLLESATADAFQIHSTTDDPDSAELILFAELYGAGPYFEKVRNHPLVKKYREKCFLFSCKAYAIPFLPGVYTSIEKRWASPRTRAGFYLGVSENEFVAFTKPADDLPYLYSFLGSTKTAPVRDRLRELVHPQRFFSGYVRPTRIAFSVGN